MLQIGGIRGFSARNQNPAAEEITMMRRLSANAQAMIIAHAKLTATILVLAFSLMLVPSARGQVVTLLYNFGNQSNDPAHPNNPGFVTQGRDGNLYSTSNDGGTDNAGTVFKITPAGQVSVLYNFDGTAGAFPSSGLTLGTDGNFYGTGIVNGPTNYGSVFKVTPKGKLTLLHGFDLSDGEDPWGAPVEGTNGDFYGTTNGGGTAGCGTMYQVTAAGKFKTLYNFDGTYGCQPLAPLTLGNDGNFYGTTVYGGMNDDGAVYKITPAGQISLLHSFDGTHGAQPYAPLIQANDGNFYGTTFDGGGYAVGVIFEISPAGNFTDLHDFSPPDGDGGDPLSGLVEGTDGVLYGTTTSGGAFNAGTVYAIGLGSGSLTVLYSFDNTSGTDAEDGLMQHTNGSFYGDCKWEGSENLGTFYAFGLGLQPFVRLVSTSTKVGKTIGILGQGFTGTTAVSFDGTTAAFRVVSKTYLTATVPSGATSGFVTVTTPGGTLQSNQVFTVIP